MLLKSRVPVLFISTNDTVRRPGGRTVYRWDPTESGCQVVDGIGLAQDRIHWILCQAEGECLIRWATSSFRSRTLLHVCYCTYIISLLQVYLIISNNLIEIKLNLSLYRPERSLRAPTAPKISNNRYMRATNLSTLAPTAFTPRIYSHFG